MSASFILAIFIASLISARSAVAATAEWAEPRDVEFKASVDGSTEHYVELLPKNFQKDATHNVIIALHGHGSDRWQYIKDARGECKGARDVALSHGFIFVSPDY